MGHREREREGASVKVVRVGLGWGDDLGMDASDQRV
jgi:hypothetical protein